MTLRIGVDIGGTFTDLVAIDDRTHEVFSTKALTTPHALADAVVTCIEQVGVDLRHAQLVIHGTTVGINALIERTGAKTALLTTAGFRDVLEIGRTNSQRSFDLLYQRSPPLVPRRHRFEASERLTATGEILSLLDEHTLEDAVRVMRAEGIESVAIVFLFSYINSSHEEKAAEFIRRSLPAASITVSHQISQEWREYERTNTAVVNAYIQPTMERYLTAFQRLLGARGFIGRLLIMESNGGAFPIEVALMKPVHTLESGPAAGAVGCAAIAGELDHNRLISFDMGGTTAKCCVVEDGYARVTDEYTVDGQPLRIPVIDITEVSAGGGSIARVDSGGALALGPRSAGSVPGPACYGLGGNQPTVTDANLAIGRINPHAFLGGHMRLHIELGLAAMRRFIAEPLGMTPEEAAMGVIRLADVKMALAVKSVTTERGLDPRDFTLLSYGGCGPLHAVAIARELAIPTVAIPPFPSTFSAWGMLATDLRHDIVRTVLLSLESTDESWAALAYDEITGAMHRIFPAGDSLILKRAVDLRYSGQEHTITIEIDTLAVWQTLREQFDRAHERAYGYSAPDVGIELLNVRLTAIVPIERPRLRKVERARGTPRPCALREIYSSLRGTAAKTPVFERKQLCAGDRIEGPAAIEETATTTYFDFGDCLHVNETGFLVITVGHD